MATAKEQVVDNAKMFTNCFFFFTTAYVEQNIKSN